MAILLHGCIPLRITAYRKTGTIKWVSFKDVFDFSS
jgi:hypothetical protein